MPERCALAGEHGQAKGMAEVLCDILRKWVHHTAQNEELRLLAPAVREAHYRLTAQTLATYSVSSLRAATEA